MKLSSDTASMPQLEPAAISFDLCSADSTASLLTEPLIMGSAILLERKQDIIKASSHSLVVFSVGRGPPTSAADRTCSLERKLVPLFVPVLQNSRIINKFEHLCPIDRWKAL